jgi:hypothetical protein
MEQVAASAGRRVAALTAARGPPQTLPTCLLKTQKEQKNPPQDMIGFGNVKQNRNVAQWHA